MRSAGNDKEILDFLFGRDADYPAPSAYLRPACCSAACLMYGGAGSRQKRRFFQYTRKISRRIGILKRQRNCPWPPAKLFICSSSITTP